MPATCDVRASQLSNNLCCSPVAAAEKNKLVLARDCKVVVQERPTKKFDLKNAKFAFRRE